MECYVSIVSFLHLLHFLHTDLSLWIWKEALHVDSVNSRTSTTTLLYPDPNVEFKTVCGKMSQLFFKISENSFWITINSIKYNYVWNNIMSASTFYNLKMFSFMVYFFRFYMDNIHKLQISPNLFYDHHKVFLTLWKQGQKVFQPTCMLWKAIKDTSTESLAAKTNSEPDKSHTRLWTQIFIHPSTGATVAEW